MNPNRQIAQLGLVANGPRNIRSGSQYNRMFNLNRLNGIRPVRMGTSDPFATLARMERIVKETLADTKEISADLKGGNLSKTTKNIWNFLYWHHQYKIDESGIEELRRPLESWRDRKMGIDCDDYATFASSILSNLKIPHAFRIAKYKDDWQHVYVVVPLTGSKSDLDKKARYHTIDPVVDQYDYEVPFSQKHDYFISLKDGLSGINMQNINYQFNSGLGFVNGGQLGVIPVASIVTTGVNIVKNIFGKRPPLSVEQGISNSVAVANAALMNLPIPEIRTVYEQTKRTKNSYWDKDYANKTHDQIARFAIDGMNRLLLQQGQPQIPFETYKYQFLASQQQVQQYQPQPPSVLPGTTLLPKPIYQQPAYQQPSLLPTSFMPTTSTPTAETTSVTAETPKNSNMGLIIGAAALGGLILMSRKKGGLSGVGHVKRRKKTGSRTGSKRSRSKRIKTLTL